MQEFTKSIEQYTDNELIQEVKRRGLELKIHVSSVEVEVSLGGIAFGETVCTERI